MVYLPNISISFLINNQVKDLIYLFGKYSKKKNIWPVKQSGISSMHPNLENYQYLYHVLQIIILTKPVRFYLQ